MKKRQETRKEFFEVFSSNHTQINYPCQVIEDIIKIDNLIKFRSYLSVLNKRIDSNGNK